MSRTDQQRLSDLFAEQGTNELWKLLRPLRSVTSFMNTGAHPDDETTPLLAALAWRDGVQVSHACANRGEGGQNAIGTESGAHLGALRTKEMERAADVIGMTQYWLSHNPDDSINDFGFSKSGDETLEIWGEDHTLKRFVGALRRERPDIVCPTFLDIPGQHGHHQAMTRSAFKAVAMAADPSAFPDQGLPVWQVKKLYLPAWSGAGDAYDDDLPPPETTTRVDAGGADPVLRMDYAQIAQYSRSFHMTQAMGSWIEAGGQMMIPLHLAWSATGKIDVEKEIFDGLPRTVRDIASFVGAPELEADLNEAQSHIDRVIGAWPDAVAAGKFALSAVRALDRAFLACPDQAKSEVLHRLHAKRRQLTKVLARSRGIGCRLDFSSGEVRAGDEFTASLKVASPVNDVRTILRFPQGWSATNVRNGQFTVKVPADAPPTNPYADTWFVDRANSPIHAVLEWQEDGTNFTLPFDPQVHLHVLPRHSVRLTPEKKVMNPRISKRVNLEISDCWPANALPELQCETGWKSDRDHEGFGVEADPNHAPGIYDFPLTLDGQAAQQISRIRYDHIGQTNLCTPAVFKVRVLDVHLPQGRFAYVGGGNDHTDHWLRQIGLPIVSLDAASFQGCRLDDYDSILIGIFAFRAHATLDDRRSELHDWIHNGGNMVTLYHRPWDNWDAAQTAPGRLEIGKPSIRWRVTDQNAPVTHLVPDHPLLNTPNQIDVSDWQGWHKERGLYFAKAWDPVYAALLSMSDGAEAPLNGALLCGEFGKGRHSHTSLILHHQVEHLVPGAFRLLANLLRPVNTAQS